MLGDDWGHVGWNDGLEFLDEADLRALGGGGGPHQSNGGAHGGSEGCAQWCAQWQ